MPSCKMLIGGKWVSADSGKTFVTVNPTTGEELGKVPLADNSDVDKAVKAARAAFPGWAGLKQSERNKVLNRIAAQIRENAQELVDCDVQEHGTPCQDAFKHVMGAAEKFEYNGAIAQALMGTQIPMEDGMLSYFKREPFGVAALIIPWNLPIIMMAVKLSAALAVGNTCIIKPPSINSLTGLKFAEIINKAGLPDGVVNFITGPGGSVGQALASHPDVNLIGFTGSSETGKDVLKYASSTVKKCVMELGGNNPTIIMEDADLDAAIEVLASRQFNNCGQHCSAPGRYYVHEKVYEAFLEKFKIFAQNIVVGDPTDKNTFMGPVTSRSHKDKIEAYISGAIAEGAKLYYTQEKKDIHRKGFFVMPTIISDVKHNMTIAKEEVFGPVAVVLKYNDKDDIIALANDSPFGLCAHLWSKDIKKGLNLADKLQVGSVFINCQTLTNEQSWGTSVKESGLGKEGGLLGLEEFTELKMITAKYAR
ncbi:MAG: aldehyde dehydrogenase [Peptococcaceae bacterium]|jgi:acyl-CoA reductase-like NAD-dependent aldehyde dehydrogenase|nr:aldehyde dehydrogenase [Peptococcaceae bacterium]